MGSAKRKQPPIFRQAKLKIEVAQKDSFAAILVDTVLKNHCLQALYEAVIGPIEDLLDGDKLIVAPDSALSLAPWSALSETLRIRTAPSLTTLNLITDSPDEYHCKSGALIVGDPCMKKVTNKWGIPIYEQLEYPKREVEMIGKILNSQPLTGEDATKQEVGSDKPCQDYHTRVLLQPCRQLPWKCSRIACGTLLLVGSH